MNFKILINTICFTTFLASPLYAMEGDNKRHKSKESSKARTINPLNKDEWMIIREDLTMGDLLKLLNVNKFFTCMVDDKFEFALVPTEVNPKNIFASVKALPYARITLPQNKYNVIRGKIMDSLYSIYENNISIISRDKSWAVHQFKDALDRFNGDIERATHRLDETSSLGYIRGNAILALHTLKMTKNHSAYNKYNKIEYSKDDHELKNTFFEFYNDENIHLKADPYKPEGELFKRIKNHKFYEILPNERNSHNYPEFLCDLNAVIIIARNYGFSKIANLATLLIKNELQSFQFATEQEFIDNFAFEEDMVEEEYHKYLSIYLYGDDFPDELGKRTHLVFKSIYEKLCEEYEIIPYNR